MSGLAHLDREHDKPLQPAPLHVKRWASWRALQSYFADGNDPRMTREYLQLLKRFLRELSDIVRMHTNGREHLLLPFSKRHGRPALREIGSRINDRAHARLTRAL